MQGHPTDKLVAGAIVGAVITALLVVLLVWLDFPSDRHYSAAVRLTVPALISACLLFPRPLLHRTVLRERRDVGMLDEDLNLLLVGRALGLVGGIIFGISLASEIL
ncbi:hypothetical protein [Paraburkholderia tagetis]|uniref:Uncharacterized protein n=1 Tax=Paraburkholderia tagetis TaxID=2913261 RepID=A0A9X2A0K6_9BURK|nr:hypothetical protein [Paraburkholderia tagetis]MCG5078125.1 hypothetical protein [Paraburkholderia tagetis]